MLGPGLEEGRRAEWKQEESEGAQGTGGVGETLVLIASGWGLRGGHTVCVTAAESPWLSRTCDFFLFPSLRSCSIRG